MPKTLTALYDLTISPLTFDFLYAVIQADVERRRRGYERLAFHIRRENDYSRFNAYSPGEAEWRLRHILAPLSQLLDQPTGLYFGSEEPRSQEVFSRQYGLHWLSDVTALAEAGEEVQLLKARPSQLTALTDQLEGVLRGRPMVTITLREARYGTSRNSDLLAWASLARLLSKEGYAVVVLRDHVRSAEALPGDWGGAVALHAPVWNIHRRLALYELAWLNLAVNNGPPILMWFSPKIRFLMFKMMGETPETSAQHCRKVGIQPGSTLSFLKPHQQLVWDIDDAGVLHEHVLRALADTATYRSVPIAARPVSECLISAARRAFRAGEPAADELARIPAGPVRTRIALERATMLLEEDRPLDAAVALGEAPAGPERSALATSIAYSAPRSDIIGALRPLMAGAGTADWNAVLQRVTHSRPVLDGTTAHKPLNGSLVAEVEGFAAPEIAVRRLAAEESRRRRQGRNLLHLVVYGGDECWLAASALFPAIAAIELRQDPVPSTIGAIHRPTIPLRGEPPLATVPIFAKRQFKAWLASQPYAKSGYAVFAPVEVVDRYAWGTAADHVRKRKLGIVSWADWASVWPIEMLAALLEGATLRILADPLAVALTGVLGLSAQSPMSMTEPSE